MKAKILQKLNWGAFLMQKVQYMCMHAHRTHFWTFSTKDLPPTNASKAVSFSKCFYSLIHYVLQLCCEYFNCWQQPLCVPCFHMPIPCCVWKVCVAAHSKLWYCSAYHEWTQYQSTAKVQVSKHTMWVQWAQEFMAKKEGDRMTMCFHIWGISSSGTRRPR